jgi:hypothetical protein
MTKKVMIGMPCYTGRLCVQTMRCLMTDTIQLLIRGDTFCFAEDVGNSDIAGSRAAILATFIRSDFDVLMFIDDDVIWEKGGMLRILDADEDIVGGLYPKKTEKLEWPVRIDLKDEYKPDPRTGLMEVAGLPGGFMKITRKAAELMIEKYPKKTRESNGPSSSFWPVFDPYDIPDDRLSEDLAFCQRWRDIGGKVWADFEIGMGHIGSKKYEGHVGNHLREAPVTVK